MEKKNSLDLFIHLVSLLPLDSRCWFTRNSAFEGGGSSLLDRLIFQGFSNDWCFLSSRCARLGRFWRRRWCLDGQFGVTTSLSGFVDSDAFIFASIFGYCLENQKSVDVVFLQSLVANIRRDLLSVLEKKVKSLERCSNASHRCLQKTKLTFSQ